MQYELQDVGESPCYKVSFYKLEYKIRMLKSIKFADRSIIYSFKNDVYQKDQIKKLKSSYTETRNDNEFLKNNRTKA